MSGLRASRRKGLHRVHAWRYLAGMHFFRMGLVAACALVAGIALPALAAPAKPLPPDSLWRGIGVREPFRTLMNSGRHVQADSITTARLAAVIASHPRDSLVMAQAINDRVETATNANHGREPAILALAERALAIHIQHPGPDSLFYARSLAGVGEVYRRRREFDQAAPPLEACWRIRARALPADDLELSGTAIGLASVYYVQARNAEALPLVTRALAIREQHYGNDAPILVPALFMRAALRRNAGDLRSGMIDILRADTLQRRVYPANHPDVLRITDAVGVFAMDLGDFGTSRRAYEQALAAVEAATPLDSVSAGREISHLLELRVMQGDGEGAVETGARAMAFMWRTEPSTTTNYGQTQYQYAQALQMVGRDREAIAYLDSSLAIDRATKQGDTTGVAPVLAEKARAYLHGGDVATALTNARAAVSLQARHGEAHPDMADFRQVLGQSLLAAGDARAALAQTDSALAVLATTVGEAHPMVTRVLETQAQARIALGDPLAFALARRVAARRTDHLRATVRGLSEREALLYAQREGFGLDGVMQLAALGKLDGAQRSQAFDALVASRALVFDELVTRGRVARGARAEAGAVLDSLAHAQAELAHEMLRDPSERTLADVDSSRIAARSRVETLERRLADMGAVRGAAAFADTGGTARLQATLGASEALVAYTSMHSPTPKGGSEARMLAWVLRADRAPVAVPLGAQAPIDALVSQWRGDVARGVTPAAERASRVSGAALRARVWDPLAAVLAGASSVHVVPEGALHLVDLGALPARAGGYLVEQSQLIAMLSSERDLLDRGDDPAGAPGGDGLLAVGGPDFDRGDAPLAGVATFRGAPIACRAFAAVRFAPLPGSLAEAGDVVRVWHDATRDSALLLSGAGAQETRFKQLAPGKRALHLATHGFFLGAGCDGDAAHSRGIGGMAPAGDAAKTAAAIASVTASPLRLSGLALAGANHRADVAPGTDDGVLTSEEIAALDLSSAREVVLSACDTGEGDVATGEGVLGLQRAFRLAGARSLVMSLWAIDDRATREWMRHYYASRLTAHMSVAASVRAADRARIATLRAAHLPLAPAAWAGFVASDAGR